MLRTITLAAAAALFASAASAQSITINLQGKTPGQVQADVRGAAEKLCRQQTEGESFPINAQGQCVANTVRQTFDKNSAAVPDFDTLHGAAY